MKPSLRSLALSFVAAVLFAGCQSGGWPTGPGSKTPAAAASAQPAARISPDAATEKAPDVFKALFSTTKGDFTLEVHRAWAPRGADRFYNLVKTGYFDGVPFFRAIDGFMVQFGISNDPAVNARWSEAHIPDDPAAGQSNKRGLLTFATSGPDSRTTQVFINYADNGRLDSMGFTPVGQVVKGMDVLDTLYKGYGEGAPRGPGPDQERLQKEGGAYWKASFPKLDSVQSARVVN